jgi:hypothetical protein
MGEDRLYWDDSSSIEELEIDWEYEPENPSGKRAYARMTAEELSTLLSMKSAEIPVKFATEKDQYIAYLIDLSQGGMRLKSKITELNETQLVKLAFNLGSKQIVSRGRVKNILQDKDLVLFGIEFVGLNGDDDGYIAELYSSVTP